MNQVGDWYATISPENRYQYNGKELDTDLGLNWYHYGFRMYDAAIGRFTGVDPIADEFAWVSAYNYAENEPVRHIDLHGLQAALPTNTQSAYNYIGEGFRRMFEGAADFIDSFRGSVSHKNVTTTSTTEEKFGNVSLKQTTKTEVSTSTQGGTNLDQFFEYNANNEVIPEGPIVEVSEKSGGKEVLQTDLKFKGKGGDLVMTNRVETNMKNNEVSVVNKVQMQTSINHKSNSKAGVSFSIYGQIVRSRKGQTIETGIQGKVKIPGPLPNNTNEFSAKIFLKQQKW